VIVATPIIAIAIPPVKLATVEKHIIFRFIKHYFLLMTLNPQLFCKSLIIIA
jgi:hypothetical protein